MRMMGPGLIVSLSLLLTTVQGFEQLEAPAAAAPAAATINNSSKVTLGVYFEALCPDSRRFIHDQLLPNFERLEPVMQVKLVPFGKARVLGNNKMMCQHGQAECRGNRLMACVMKRAANASDDGDNYDYNSPASLPVVRTIGCLFYQQTRDSLQECVAKNLAHVNVSQVEECAASDESYLMMERFERETGNRPAYVPELRLDNKQSAEIQSDCEDDLVSCICRHHDATASPGSPTPMRRRRSAACLASRANKAKM